MGRDRVTRGESAPETLHLRRKSADTSASLAPSAQGQRGLAHSTSVLRLQNRHAVSILAAVAAALAFVGSGAADPPAIAQKEAEQQQVLAQVHAIDIELERAAEAFNGATYRLDQIRADIAENRARLRFAQQNYRRAQHQASARLVELYKSGGGGTSVAEILIGASSLSDLLTRIDAASRISEQDARIAHEVEVYRAEVRRRERQLEAAEAAQRQEVARRAAERDAIAAKLAERRQLLATIGTELERLRAAERERQARLEEQARQRLAEERRQRQAQASQPSQPEQQPTQTESTSTQAAPEPAPEPEPAPSPDSSGGSSSGSTSSGGSSGGGSPPAPSHGGVVGIAMQYLGTPYVWGGASPSGFDCSGFTMYVYAQVGVSLPHYAAAQYGMGTPVSRSSLAPGDLVFFNGLSHVGIYIGGNQMIHSPHTGDVVKISSLTGWYASTYVGARRY